MNPTHSGIVNNNAGSRKIKLRETKCYWVSPSGIRYSKAKNGLCTSSSDWNIERLDLSSIKKFGTIINL